jgi:hypothetical protein
MKIDKIRLRVESVQKMKNYRPKCTIKKSQDGMRKLNYDLEEKLNQLKLERAKRIQSCLESSDECEAEVLLNYDNFAQNLKKRTPVRAGKIQRNIVIPLQSNLDEVPPRIKSKCFYKRDKNGEMTFDVKLDFEDGVVVNDKLTNGIYIKSALPARNLFGRK